MNSNHYHLPIFILLTTLINGKLLVSLSDQEQTLVIDTWINLPNPSMKNAYIAFQAWKKAIISDPQNITATWSGCKVCSYTGVYCAPSPEFPFQETVAGIDLNGADLSGQLPEELGLLYDIALIHLNSNRFCGKIPRSFLNFKLLFELDLSNNRFSGDFPVVFLQLPKLKFLDIRFNEFQGEIPERLFEISFDAIFLNHNRFSFSLPKNIWSSSASVIVLANNKLHGCLPASLTNFSSNMNEIILRNNNFESCLPDDIGNLKNLTVLDLGFNRLFGTLPKTINNLMNLEVLDLSNNMLSGRVFGEFCGNTCLQKFEISYNFFTDATPRCLDLSAFDGRRNCLNERPKQRSQLQCKMFFSRQINRSSCGTSNSPSLPSPSPLPPVKCNYSCNSSAPSPVDSPPKSPSPSPSS